MGFEKRFEKIINDPAWAKVAQNIAFDNVMDPCLIEKAFYRAARLGAFENIRELAIGYKVAYTQQLDRCNEDVLQVPQQITSVLRSFQLACASQRKDLNCTRTFYAIKEAFCQDLRRHCVANNWNCFTADEAVEMLLKEALIDYARHMLYEALIKAANSGHGTYQNLSRELDKVLSNVSLTPLIEAIFSGQEKSITAPRCRREKIDDLLNDDLV